MKPLIRLIIAGLIIHATWRAGTVFWKNYQFRDGVQQTALFSGRRTDAELRLQVMALAKAYEIPLDPERLTVQRPENYTVINASYDERIEVLPRYFYPWTFNVNVDALTLIAR